MKIKQMCLNLCGFISLIIFCAASGVSYEQNRITKDCLIHESFKTGNEIYQCKIENDQGIYKKGN